MNIEKSRWIYYDPVFECDAHNGNLLRFSPWAGHRRWAYDYVRNEKPSRIVELGSHYGSSSFAFLQAVKDGDLLSEFVAVDTWAGDAYTENDYDRENVFASYSMVEETCYNTVNSRKMRMTFDEASGQIPDGSVDLLHIDGSHLYEDVRHDFETWKGKAAPDGSIWLHDVGYDLFRGKPMGSNVFWNELVKEYPYTIMLPYSCGLGMLFFSKERYERIRAVLKEEKYQRDFYIQDSLAKDQIRQMSFRIRDLEIYNEDLAKQAADLNKYADQKESYNKTLEEDIHIRDEKLKQMALDMDRQNAAWKKTADQKDAYICELEAVKENYAADAAKREEYIKTLEDGLAAYASESSERNEYIEELKNAVFSYVFDAEEKDRYIGELKAGLAQYASDTAKQKKYIEELKSAVTSSVADGKERDRYIEELKNAIASYGSDAAEKDRYIEELKAGLDAYASESSKKDDYIRELKSGLEQYASDTAAQKEYIEELKAGLDAYASESSKKDDYIRELKSGLEQYASDTEERERFVAELQTGLRDYALNIEKKDAYIAELQETIRAYAENTQKKDEYIRELEEQRNRLTKGFREEKNGKNGESV